MARAEETIVGMCLSFRLAEGGKQEHAAYRNVETNHLLFRTCTSDGISCVSCVIVWLVSLVQEWSYLGNTSM